MQNYPKCSECGWIEKNGHLSRHKRRRHAVPSPGQAPLKPENEWECPLCEKKSSKSQKKKHNDIHHKNPDPGARDTEASRKALVEKTLSECDGRLAILAAALNKAIENIGGLQQPKPLLESETTDLESPAILAASECWDHQPADFLSDLIHHFNRERDKVYINGMANSPVLGSPISEVLKQLEVPRTDEVYFAINISGSAKMRLPMRFHQYEIYSQGGFPTTTNITPKYSFVDLHIGKVILLTLGSLLTTDRSWETCPNHSRLWLHQVMDALSAHETESGAARLCGRF